MSSNVPGPNAPPPSAVPLPINITVQAGTGDGVAPPPSSPASPASEGVTATLDPTAKAGVDLATIVLAIVSGSIMLLIGYLVVMEFLVASNVRSAYEQVVNSSRVGSELYTLDRFERLENGLTNLRNFPSTPMPPDDLKKAKDFVAMLGDLPSLTSVQKTQLDYCITPPPLADVDRAKKLNGCVDILTGITKAALDAAASAVSAQIAGESANKINEQRQALHTFWIQAAQLILLNLLLPLLTALLGYIFGKQR